LRIDETLDAAFADSGESAEHDANEIEGEGQGLSVEVAAREDVASLGFAGLELGLSDLAFVREDQRVIDGGIHLDLKNLARVGQRVSHGSVDLRDATQGVRILDTGAVAMTFAKGAALHHATQIRGDLDLPGMRTGLMDARVEGDVGALQCIERYRSDDVSGVGECFGLEERERTDGEHGLGAVNERDGFLGFERDGLDSCGLESFGSCDGAAVESGEAFADEHLGEMGERCEVAAGPDGTLRGNDGMNAAIQHLAEGVDDDGADAAESFGE
jgi:hypothetical protein